MENKCPVCEKKKNTPRNKEEIKNIQTRLNRIIGQLNGVSNMINENRYCGDVLIQISAAENALQQLGFLILKEHLESCVVEDIKNNDMSSLEESIDIIRRLK